MYFSVVQLIKWLPITSTQVSLKGKVKVKGIARTRLLRVGFQSWSRYFAISLQVTWVINPVVGCHYFLPGGQLSLQSLRGLLSTLQLGEYRDTMDVCPLPKSFIRQRCDCDLNSGLLRLSPACYLLGRFHCMCRIIYWRWLIRSRNEVWNV